MLSFILLNQLLSEMYFLYDIIMTWLDNHFERLIYVSMATIIL